MCASVLGGDGWSDGSMCASVLGGDGWSGVSVCASVLGADRRSGGSSGLTFGWSPIDSCISSLANFLCSANLFQHAIPA